MRPGAALHSSKNDSWVTPQNIVNRAHTLFGGPPDLDPASSPEANGMMRAKQIITREQDALTVDWPVVDTLWLNPPGGKLRGKSMAGLFWGRFVWAYRHGRFKRGLFLGFSLNILQVAQAYDVVPPTDFPLCIPRNRISFVLPDESGTSYHEGGSATHPNVIVYAGPRGWDDDRFLAAFGGLGATSFPTSRVPRG